MVRPTEATRMVVSALTRALIPVVELARPGGTPLDPADIEEAVAGHGLGGDSSPAWMVAWFVRIAARQPSPTLFEVPAGYPAGDEGLVNLLLDIEEALGPLGIVDEGESLKWVIPAAGLTVLTLRETAGDGYYGAMRPTGSDINGWLRDQYRQLQLGGSLAQLAEPSAPADGGL